MGVDHRKRSPVLSPQLTPSRFSKDPNSPTLNAVRLARIPTERTRRALKDSARYYSSQRAAVDWSPGRSPQRLCRLCDLFVAPPHASCNPPNSPLLTSPDLTLFQRNSDVLRTPERTFGAGEKRGSLAAPRPSCRKLNDLDAQPARGTGCPKTPALKHARKI